MDEDYWHAIDAPFTPMPDWWRLLEAGSCTRCGQPAERGQTHWWHIGRACWDVRRRRFAEPPAEFRPGLPVEVAV